MNAPDHRTALASLVASQLAQPRTGWAIGAFGAIGEFMRDPDEPVELGATTAVTARGAIHLTVTGTPRAIAYETPLGEDGWSGGIALCVSESENTLPRHTTLTELGLDCAAIRPPDRAAILFDMGLALGNGQACVRSADPGTVALLRRFCGRRLIEHASAELFMRLPALSPQRVFISALGRIEVYQRIPAHDDKTPEGPHTHVLPKLLQARRTHAADVPIPAGWLPAATLYPANPVRDALGRRRPFDASAMAAWNALYAQYGPPEARSAKDAALAALERGTALDSHVPATRGARLATRMAARQWQARRRAAGPMDEASPLR